MLCRHLVIVFIFLTFPAYSGNNTLTGFLPNSIGATPVSQDYSGTRPAIALDQIKSVTFIVYMHGTRRPIIAEDCSSKASNRMPDVLKQLNDMQVVIFYLCSSATETLSFMPGSYIFNRLDELEGILDEFLAQAVEPSQIFLAGHSAGGWTALMAAHRFQEKFAGAIAFAPASFGKKNQRGAWISKLARPHQIKKMLSAEDINALVFAYHNDPYEDPESLSFLNDKPSVKLVSFHCRHHHSAVFYGCKSEDTASNIYQFLRKSQQ